MPTAYGLNLDHPEILRALLVGIVRTGHVIGRDSKQRVVLAVAVDNWLLDELAAMGAQEEDAEDDDPDELWTAGGHDAARAFGTSPTTVPVCLDPL